MITIIPGFQTELHFIGSAPFLCSQHSNRIGEILLQFFLGNATKCLVTIVHADILRLVETAEHTNLRELGDTRQQHELQISVGTLEGGIESFQRVPVLVFHRSIKHIQNRLVVFIHQHHGTATILFTGTTEHFLKTVAHGQQILVFPIHALRLPQKSLYFGFQHTFLGEVVAIEVDMEHRILIPVFLQFFHRQPFKEFFPAPEIGFECRNQQTLAKAPRAAEEIDFPAGHHLMDKSRLVHVHITVFTEIAECLYSDRIFHTVFMIRFYYI